MFDLEGILPSPGTKLSDVKEDKELESATKPKPFNTLKELTYKTYQVTVDPYPEPTEQHVQIFCHDSTTPFLLPLAPLLKHSRLFFLLSKDPSDFSSSPEIANTQTLTDIPIDFSTEGFRPFARWLTGGPIAVPRPETDAHGFNTDIYLLMHAHATGEVLMAPVFTDVVMDAIIAELTSSSTSDCDSALGSDPEDPDFEALDRAAKARDLDLLLPAAAAVWPKGTLGRQFIVDFYAHSPAWRFAALNKQLLVGEGLDRDFVAGLLLAVAERRLSEDLDMDLKGSEPWVRDPCRYHVHRSEGRGCYRRTKSVGFCELEWVVRDGLNDRGKEGDGWVGTAFDYRDCVDEVIDDGET